MGFFQKVLIVLAVIGIIILLFFGSQIKSIYQFIFIALILGIMIGLIYMAIRGFLSAFQRKLFSPTSEFFASMVNIAKDCMPPNVFDLYFEGSERRSPVKYGKIVGLAHIPYLTGVPEKNEKGEIVYTRKLDPYGRKIPKFKQIKISEEEDGDTLFIVKRGSIFPSFHYVRCNPLRHSELIGDVYISDISPIKYGKFEYPYKQYKQESFRVMAQNQLETIITTIAYQHDLISVIADTTLSFNPQWQMIRRQTAEQLVTPNR
jgi:hypothetical protein